MTRNAIAAASIDAPTGGSAGEPLTIRGLTKRFGRGVVAVDDLDLDIRPGEFLTLLGPSGCGKTTTLRCLAGLEAPDAGEIRLGGRVLTSTVSGTWVPPEKRGAGMVFQSYALWPHMRVTANVGYPLRMAGVPSAEVKARVARILEVMELTPLAGRLATELSGGQQQRVALARAMVASPALLLFDEPLSNLDARLRTDMRVELRRLHEESGTTSVYVTHDQSEAMVLSDRVAVMRSGRIRQLAAPEEVYTRPADRGIAAFVGFNNFLDATVVERRGDEVLVRLGSGDLLWATASSDDLIEGREVVLAARSGSFTVGGPANDLELGSFRVRVTQSSYLGDCMQYRAEVAGEQLVVDVSIYDVVPDGAGARRWDVGEHITVSVAPRWLVALPQETGDHGDPSQRRGQGEEQG